MYLKINKTNKQQQLQQQIYKQHRLIELRELLEHILKNFL